MFSGMVVLGQFQLESFLSEGGFGQVYLARDLKNNNTLAIKTEKLDCKLPLLVKEAECLQELDFFAKNQQKELVPKFYGYGESQYFRYMMMELCSSNVRELKKATSFDRFSVTTSLWILKKMVQAVEFMHRNGWIHRDIKPPNFCISPNNPRRLVLVDFGTSERSQTPNKTLGFCGTDRYAALRTHMRMVAHESDDLWSIYYIAVENINGQLPWRTILVRNEIMMHKKPIQETPEIIQGLIPHPWFTFVHPPNSLKFFLRQLAEGIYNASEFNYQALIHQIDHDLKLCNFNEQYSPLDWELKNTMENFIFGAPYPPMMPYFVPAEIPAFLPPPNQFN